MWWKLIFIIVVISPQFLRCQPNKINTGFELLQSVNTLVQSIRTEQNLLAQQLKEDRERIHEAIKDIKDDIEQFKAEQKKIREDQEEIKQDQKELIAIVKELKAKKICDDKGNQNETTPSFVRNCDEARSFNKSEVNVLLTSYSSHPFNVACDMQMRGGGWTIIWRRLDGNQNFYKSWPEYKQGFGDISGEYFLGLDKIHALTSDMTMELLVLFVDSDGITTYASYNEFGIGSEDQSYRLDRLGQYSGNAGDVMFSHRDMKFTTHDRDNDLWGGNCASQFSGAWWYNSCFFKNDVVNNWRAFRGDQYLVKKAVLMLRPTK